MAMAHDDVRIDGHRIIGTYSSTDEADYVNDDRNRRFYLDPGNEFNFNYEEAFRSFTDRGERANVELPRVGEKYKWMRDHRQVLIDNGILDTDQSRLNVDFVSDRNVLCGILKMGGQEDWHIKLAVTLYKGTYHLCKTRDNAELQDEGARLRAASSRLLLKFVTSRDGLTPDEPPVPANENERFFALTTVNCGNHRLLVRGEIQAEKRISPNEPPPPLPNARNCLNVRSRKSYQYIDPMKALAWWAANKIAGIPETRYGLRDDERRTIERIATIQTDRLATSRFTMNRWDPGVCIRTMESLLSQIIELVPEDDPNSFKQAVLIIRPVDGGRGVEHRLRNRTFEIRDRLEGDLFVEEHEIRSIY